MSGQQKDLVLYCKRCAFRVIGHNMCRVCGCTKFYQAEVIEPLSVPIEITDNLPSSSCSSMAKLARDLWLVTISEWVSFEAKVKEALRDGSVQSIFEQASQKFPVQFNIKDSMKEPFIQSQAKDALQKLSIQSKGKDAMQMLSMQGKAKDGLQERSFKSKLNQAIGEISATAMNVSNAAGVGENEMADPALSQGLVRTRLNQSLMKKLQR
jgi:hypothetical protein